MQRRALSWLGLMTVIAIASACDRRYIHLDDCPDCMTPFDGGTGGDGGAATAGGPLVAGTAFSCVNAAGALYCWGVPPLALLQAGPNDPGAPSRAARAADVSTSLPAAAGGTLCALQSGGVACWGNNDTGQLGAPPTMTCSPGNCGAQRSDVPGTDGAVGLAVSGSHGCAVMGDGRVVCWGANDTGQLGHAPGGDDVRCASSDVIHCGPFPTFVGITDAVEVAVGADASGAHGFSCARRRDGSVICWGDNTKGQISGAGFVVAGAMDREVHPPTPIPGLNAKALAAGGLSICAVDAFDGRVHCWGDGSAGQGGPPASIQILDGGTAGAAIDLDQVTSLAHGALHVCAVRLGTVYCWGNNSSYQLGRDRHIAFDAPCVVDGQGDYCSVLASPVLTLSDAVIVGAGGNHTCARRRDGLVFCWGSNTFQESGYPLRAFGDLDPQRTPVLVQGFIPSDLSP